MPPKINFYAHFGCLSLLLGAVACAPSQQTESTAPASHQAAASVAAGSDSVTPVAAAKELPIPRIPAIIVPDFLQASSDQLAFEQHLPIRLDPKSGIRVYPARCEQQQLLVGDGSILSRSDSHATQVNEQGVLSVEQSGAGLSVNERTTLSVNADGSGSIVSRLPNGDDVTVSVNADGSGSYVGPEGTISIDGKGGGTWVSNQGTISIHADGSGEWVGDAGSIDIDANGAGTWIGAEHLTNHGDGTGEVGVPAEKVAMAPWPAPPKVGKMPRLNTLRMPGQVCGYIISLDDSVLFDFDRYDLRADAQTILTELSQALAQVHAQSIEIRGHTDSKGTDEYNQTLSENRAQAVLKALQAHAALAHASAKGYGETQPIVPNEVDGKDAPANRQLNRRVEIFVRTD